MKDVSRMMKHIFIALGLVVLIMFVMNILVIGGLALVMPSFASTLESKPSIGPPLLG